MPTRRLFCSCSWRPLWPPPGAPPRRWPCCWCWRCWRRRWRTGAWRGTWPGWRPGGRWRTSSPWGPGIRCAWCCATARGAPCSLDVRDVYPPPLAVRLEGRELAPGAAVAVPGRLPRPLAPGEETALTYRLWPRERGDFAFGGLYLRAAGPLGFVRRSYAVPGTDSQGARLPQPAPGAALRAAGPPGGRAGGGAAGPPGARRQHGVRAPARVRPGRRVPPDQLEGLRPAGAPDRQPVRDGAQPEPGPDDRRRAPDGGPGGRGGRGRRGGPDGGRAAHRPGQAGPRPQRRPPAGVRGDAAGRPGGPPALHGRGAHLPAPRTRAAHLPEDGGRPLQPARRAGGAGPRAGLRLPRGAQPAPLPDRPLHRPGRPRGVDAAGGQSAAGRAPPPGDLRHPGRPLGDPPGHLPPGRPRRRSCTRRWWRSACWTTALPCWPPCATGGCCAWIPGPTPSARP